MTTYIAQPGLKSLALKVPKRSLGLMAVVYLHEGRRSGNRGGNHVTCTRTRSLSYVVVVCNLPAPTKHTTCTHPTSKTLQRAHSNFRLHSLLIKLPGSFKYLVLLSSEHFSSSPMSPPNTIFLSSGTWLCEP